MTAPLRLTLVLAAVLAALPAQAQYRGSDDVRFSPREPDATTLAVGPFILANQFGYAGLQRPGVPAQERTGLGLQLAGRAVRLTVGYVGAGGDGPGVTEAPGKSALAALEVGPSFRPVASGDSVYVGLRVPVKLGLGYEYLQPAQPTDGTAGPQSFHLGRVGLGVGLGLEAGTLVDGTAFSEVVGRLSLMLQPGVLTDFSEGAFNDTFGQRTAVFDVDVRVLRLGGSGVGLLVGYTRQDTRRSPTPLGGDAGVLDAVSASGYVDQSQFGILRVGVAL